MHLSTEVKGEAAVVTITGDLDAATAPQAADYLTQTLADGGAAVILDLSGVGFMSSAGLRFILDTHQRAKAAGIRIVLAAPGPGVDKVLTNSGFTRILDCYSTVDEALPAVG